MPGFKLNHVLVKGGAGDKYTSYTTGREYLRE